MGNSLLHTRLTERLGCRHPIIQTAMGWIAEPPLVAAVCDAGGFGFLGAAVMTPAELTMKIADLRARTAQPFGVNFHMFQPGAAAIVELIIANRAQIRAVSFGRGPDAQIIRRFRDAGILCIPTVGAVKHALKMVELGVDMITVQGGEGGGHTGSVATTILLPQVLDAVDVPVIAAGGFADGRGLAAALAYGAAGIAMGTRFLLTQESPVPAATKHHYLAAGTDQIFVTTKIDGMPQRMLRNALAQRIDAAGRTAMAARALHAAWKLKAQTGASFKDLYRAARGMTGHGGLTWGQALMAASAPMLIQKAVVEGCPDDGLMATGLVAGRLRDVPTCLELIDRIMTEATTRLTALGQLADVPLATAGDY
ncbi:MAG: nitronate monooxygenase [Pseudomonadota bacterium]|jgi:NAD(P)H-dependent flavin oxidoreductase YrpB (nitropropane dioxygenase family)